MGGMRWSALKSERLKKTRGVSFEEIVVSKYIGKTNHPTKEHQEILVYEHKNYLWAVPFVVEGEGIFLKTLYPSRKLMKTYKGKE
jgi:hypothetical protein